MEPRAFDDLVRHLAVGSPRRRIVGGLAAVVAAGLTPNAALACKKVGKKCDKTKDCCDGAKCGGGECKCKGSREECGGKCYKLDTDEQHCGACGNACAGGETCCGGACVDLQRDATNCGGCGDACEATEECVAGTCVTPTGGCAPGANSCAGEGNIPCGSGCNCSRSTEGATLCGLSLVEAQCGQCDTSADCAAFGPGAFCVETGAGEGGCCGPTQQNVCRLPCPE
jgi:hypothetical protein